MPYPNHDEDLGKLKWLVERSKYQLEEFHSSGTLDEIIIIIVGPERPPWVTGPWPPLTSPTEMGFLTTVAEQIDLHITQAKALSKFLLDSSNKIIAENTPEREE